MTDALKRHWPEYLIEAACLGLFMVSAFAFGAILAEIGIAFILMTVILNVSNNSRIHKFTGLCAGALVATYITFEAPISGMSMNPARTFASAVPARHWVAFWVYVTAPLIGMLAAAEVYARTKGKQSVACAKLHHENHTRCIFCGKPAGKVRSESSLTIPPTVCRTGSRKLKARSTTTLLK